MEYLRQLDAFLDSGRWLKLLFLLGGLMLLVLLARIQRGNNPVDFKRMLLDDNNVTSPTRIFQTGCFLASTWAFVVLANNNQLTEWYFTGYILSWSGTRLATKWMDSKYSVPPTPTATATATGAGATATVTTPPA